MQFHTACGSFTFEITTEWWDFCEVDKFDARSRYYPYRDGAGAVEVVDLRQIQPPSRAEGTPMFRKYKLVPILLGFTSPECEIAPVEVIRLTDAEYNYELKNGFHRYYASVAVGYDCIPALISG